MSDEAHRRKSSSVSEEPGEPRKLSDKNRTHSFILDLEQGSDELLRQRPLGKFERHSRKDQHPKDRKDKERERSVSDESVKIKQKPEKKAETHGDESSQREGPEAKASSSEDKGEKKSSKLKVEKKRSSVSEGSAVEEGQRDVGSKKMKSPTAEAVKDKEKEKERTKGEKVAGKSDPRQPLHPDSTGSSEERSDLELGSEGIRRKDRFIKEGLKRSRSMTDTKHVEKHRSRLDSKDSDKEKSKGALSSPERQKPTSETEGEPRRSRDAEPGSSKGKILSEKSRSKSREESKTPTQSKPDKKASGQDTKSKAATSVSKTDSTKEKKKYGGAKEEKKPSEELSTEKSQETKSAKKPSEKKAKDPEKKGDTLADRRGGKAVDVAMGSPLSPVMAMGSPLSPVIGSKAVDVAMGSPLSPVMPEIPETPDSAKASEPKESSVEVDPTAATSTPPATGVVAVSDDAFDALSDITPEPEDEDVATRLVECEEEPRPLPAEAAALLSLMEVCSSAERSFVTETEPKPEPEPEPMSEVTPIAGLSLQEADLKMKEAALTLLSMDPDMILSPSLINSHMTPVATEAITPPEEQATPTVGQAGEESLVDSSGNVQGAESTQPSQEMPADQHVHGEGTVSCHYVPVRLSH